MPKSKPRFAAYLLTVLMLSTVAGCSHSPPVTARGSCAWVEPILPTCADTASRSLRQQIVTHNTMWAQEKGVPLPPVQKDACP